MHAAWTYELCVHTQQYPPGAQQKHKGCHLLCKWQMANAVQQVAWLYISIFVAAAVLVGALVIWRMLPLAACSPHFQCGKKCIAVRKSGQVTDMHAVAPGQAPA